MRIEHATRNRRRAWAWFRFGDGFNLDVGLRKSNSSEMDQVFHASPPARYILMYERFDPSRTYQFKHPRHLLWAYIFSVEHGSKMRNVLSWRIAWSFPQASKARFANWSYLDHTKHFRYTCGGLHYECMFDCTFPKNVRALCLTLCLSKKAGAR